MCTLPRRPNPSPLAAARLQLTTTCRAAWPLVRRLSSHIGYRAGVDYLTQRSRLQLLHRLEDRVLNLHQRGFWMRSPPLRQLSSRRLACNLPPRQDLFDLVLTHTLTPAALSALPERHFTGSRKT